MTTKFPKLLIWLKSVHVILHIMKDFITLNTAAIFYNKLNIAHHYLRSTCYLKTVSSKVLSDLR